MHSRQIELYQRHITRLTGRIKALQRRSNRLATWRLFALFGGGAVTLVLAFTPYLIPFLAALVGSTVSFGLLVREHRRVEISLNRHKIWRSIKRGHLARLQLDWDKLPPMQRAGQPHPLETDLDLLQLHRLLNTAITETGEDRLRDWLLPAHPDMAESQHRQQLVQELASVAAFRDKLALHSRLTTDGRRRDFNTSAIHDWLSETLPDTKIVRSLLLLSALAGLNLVLFLLMGVGIISQQVMGIAFAVYVLAYLSRMGLMNAIGADGQYVSDLLNRLQAVMSHLERYPYAGMPHTHDLIAPLQDAKPSRHLRRLNISIGATSLRGNPIVWLSLNAVMPWDLFFLRRLNTQKAELAEQLPQWLDIWYAVEALNSLATFAHLQGTQAAMPRLHDNPKQPILVAKGIGHPLIHAEKRVCNDFTFAQNGELVILTGSNMSGKSSFLRTLGVNLALAYAGAPVIAQAMDARVLRVFSSIRVTDSLDDGISYFYAEVKRLRALLDALRKRNPQPIFFLIDEIFRGTNNRERLIGSRSFIHALVGENGTGLIATHDLELTQIADDNPLVRNMHFREHINNNEMIFTYRLLDGPSPTTNALHIMALEGLPVEWPEDMTKPDDAQDNRQQPRAQ